MQSAVGRGKRMRRVSYILISALSCHFHTGFLRGTFKKRKSGEVFTRRIKKFFVKRKRMWVSHQLVVDMISL